MGLVDPVAHFAAHGWARLTGLMPAPSWPALLAEADAWAARFPEDAAWNTLDDRMRGQLVAPHDLHTQPAWAALTFSESVCGALARLLGTPTATPVDSTLILKPARQGQGFAPHQDSAYYGTDGAGRAVALFHLDTTTPEMGPIRFEDGSHRGGHRKHYRAGKYYLDADLAAMTEVCADAGDVVASSIYTVHGSYPNRSDRDRRYVRVIYEGQ